MLPYYLFTFFLFLLVCVVLLLWRFLFAGLRREQMQLELKEAQIHELLEAVRKEADDFFDLASDKSAEIAEERKKIAALVSGLSLPGIQDGKLTTEPQAKRPNASNSSTSPKSGKKTAKEEPVSFSDFQRAIDDAAEKQNAPKSSSGTAESELTTTPKANDKSKTSKSDANTETKHGTGLAEPTSGELENHPNKREQIFKLSDDNFTEGEIAQRLGLTRNEVALALNTR
jgi:hypothetical protein